MKLNSVFTAAALAAATLTTSFAQVAKASDAWQVIPKGQWEIVLGEEGNTVVDSLFSALMTTQFRDCTLKSDYRHGFAKLDIYVAGKKDLASYISNQPNGWGVARRLSPQPSIQLFYRAGTPLEDTAQPGFFTQITTDTSGRRILKMEVIQYSGVIETTGSPLAYGDKKSSLKRTVNVSCTAK